MKISKNHLSAICKELWEYGISQKPRKLSKSHRIYHSQILSVQGIACSLCIMLSIRACLSVLFSIFFSTITTYLDANENTVDHLSVGSIRDKGMSLGSHTSPRKAVNTSSRAISQWPDLSQKIQSPVYLILESSYKHKTL